MRLTAAALFVLALAVPTFAQTVERTIDLASFGWGPLETPISVETDGDFSTREWLVRSIATRDYRVVAERGAGICAGPWFNPAPMPMTGVSVQRVGTVHKMLVQPWGSTVITMLALDTPACP